MFYISKPQRFSR